MTQDICRIGDALGIVIPAEVLAKLSLGEGDRVQIVETTDGIRIIPVDTEHLKQVELGLECMTKYDDVLRELAK